MISFRSILAFNGTLIVRGFIVLIAISSVAAAWEIETPFNGVTYNMLRGSDAQPLVGWGGAMIDCDVMEIDLGVEGISFVTTPSNGATAGDTDPQTTLDFLQSSGAQIAINAAPFTIDGVDGGYYTIGRHYSAGNEVNADVPTGVPSVDISSLNVPTLLTSEMTLPSYWNTISGKSVLVSGGTAIDDGLFNSTSRSAIGYNPATNKLILATADYSGMSDGATSYQLAQLMAGFGADWAVELDSDYSSQMAMNSGTATYVNTPLDPYTTVATHLGVNAVVNDSLCVFANFEHGNKSTFGAHPSYSGSCRGLDPDRTSTATVIDTDAGDGQGCMEISIYKDPTWEGDWFLRLLSGIGVPANNVLRVTDGYIGFMAKTSTPGMSASLFLDEDPTTTTGDRGEKRDMIADGEWHWYQWNLDDVDDWTPWLGSGNGEMDAANFTIDSLHFWGPTDAVFQIDQVSHDLDGPLAPIVPDNIPGDANSDGKVDGSDVTILAGNWQKGVSDGLTASWAEGDFNGDGKVDGSDVTILAGNWQYGVEAVASSVPEPSSMVLLLSIFGGLFVVRRCK